VIPAIASVRMFTGVGAVGVVISGRDYQTFIRVSRLREIRKSNNPKPLATPGCGSACKEFPNFCGPIPCSKPCS